MKDLDYRETEQLIRDLPMTWIPALLILMVKVAYEKKVFVKGRATLFIKSNIEGEEAWPS